ncbi:MAG TPA: RHS repeat-associated core domain-containing protein [Actinomycetota bacterium]|nr:RHS repeat-associated core domain-containing protein [Actinomycetota bacterium]
MGQKLQPHRRRAGNPHLQRPGPAAAERRRVRRRRKPAGLGRLGKAALQRRQPDPVDHPGRRLRDRHGLRRDRPVRAHPGRLDDPAQRIARLADGDDQRLEHRLRAGPLGQADLAEDGLRAELLLLLRRTGLGDRADGRGRQPAGQLLYDPFGAHATATAVNGALPANPWRWMGGYLDASTGLYHFGERYYDQTFARFLQVDPIKGGCANDYTYVFGDPINANDITGRATNRDSLRSRVPLCREASIASIAVNGVSGARRVMVGAAALVPAPLTGPLAPAVVAGGLLQIGLGAFSLNKAVKSLVESDQWVRGCSLMEHVVSFGRQVFPFGRSEVLDKVGGTS